MPRLAVKRRNAPDVRRAGDDNPLILFDNQSESEDSRPQIAVRIS